MAWCDIQNFKNSNNKLGCVIGQQAGIENWIVFPVVIQEVSQGCSHPFTSGSRLCC